MKQLKTNSWTTVITQVKHSDQYGVKYYALVGVEERSAFIDELKNNGWYTGGFGIYTKDDADIVLSVLDNLCEGMTFKHIV